MHPPPTDRILVILEAPPSPTIQSLIGSPCNEEDATRTKNEEEINWKKHYNLTKKKANNLPRFRGQ